MLLTDAELVLGLSRHLAAYAGGSAKGPPKNNHSV
jgi:hypothetical protein